MGIESSTQASDNLSGYGSTFNHWLARLAIIFSIPYFPFSYNQTYIAFLPPQHLGVNTAQAAWHLITCTIAFSTEGPGVCIPCRLPALVLVTAAESEWTIVASALQLPSVVALDLKVLRCSNCSLPMLHRILICIACCFWEILPFTPMIYFGTVVQRHSPCVTRLLFVTFIFAHAQWGISNTGL